MSEVYVASALKDRYPDILTEIRHAVEHAGHGFSIVESSNIWIRDWMPIPVGDHFVKFRTKADTAKYPFLEVPNECFLLIADDLDKVHKQMQWNDPRREHGKLVVSDLILDGGNVVRSPDGKRCIVTYQFDRDNVGRGGSDSGQNFHNNKGELPQLLEAEVIAIPPEPGDTLGHADGIVAWIDDTHVFVNDYSGMDDPVWRDYEADVRLALHHAEILPVTFPWFGHLSPEMPEAEFREKFPLADDFNPGWGYGINFLRIDFPTVHESRRKYQKAGLILYPTFGPSGHDLDEHNACEQDWETGDEQTRETLAKWFPGHSLAPIDCQAISMEGGLVHCVTWEA